MPAWLQVRKGYKTGRRKSWFPRFNDQGSCHFVRQCSSEWNYNCLGIHICMTEAIWFIATSHAWRDEAILLQTAVGEFNQHTASHSADWQESMFSEIYYTRACMRARLCTVWNVTSPTISECKKSSLLRERWQLNAGTRYITGSTWKNYRLTLPN